MVSNWVARHGIDKEALMQINNKWLMVLEITMLDGGFAFATVGSMTPIQLSFYENPLLI